MGMKDLKPAAMPSALEVHIEELVLHGFSTRDRFAIGDALQQELERLMTEQGLPGVAGQSLSAQRLDGGVFTVAPGARSAAIGAHIAGRVHQGLSPAQKKVAADRYSKGAPDRR